MFVSILKLVIMSLFRYFHHIVTYQYFNILLLIRIIEKHSLNVENYRLRSDELLSGAKILNS